MKFVEEDFKRMYWHSRRGMLELDLLLIPFAQKHLRSQQESVIEQYRELLQEEDQDIFLWLTCRAEAPEANLRSIVELILRKSAEDGVRGIPA